MAAPHRRAENRATYYAEKLAAAPDAVAAVQVLASQLAAGIRQSPPSLAGAAAERAREVLAGLCAEVEQIRVAS